MQNNSVIHRICKAIKLAGKPVNTNFIFEALDNQDIETKKKTIDVLLCANKKLFNRIKADCCECGHYISYYSLSDDALVLLANLERTLVEPSESEWRDLGINVNTARKAVDGADDADNQKPVCSALKTVGRNVQ